MTPPPPVPGMVPPAPKKKGMSRGLKIGLIIALIIIVLIVVGIVVGVFAFVKVISGPADAANNFVKALNNGNITEAYNMLTPTTQKDATRAGFATQFGKFKGNIKKYFTSNINVTSKGATVKMDITYSDNSTDTWSMGLLKLSGVWKIQSIRSNR
jgi:hypothetical protein